MADKKIKLLITGGAGFIGSNLVEKYINDKRVKLIRVIDNLSNGYIENIKKYLNHPKVEFINGDIRDRQMCMSVCKGIDKISHQAALGSVPRSIEDPALSAEVNIIGTINILDAAVKCNVDRVILALSSSTYGDNQSLPKIEDKIGNPLSPYAITKFSIEQFVKVFEQLYGLNWIGIRYFNVFGPKQSPSNPYAAVIPIFCNASLNNKPIYVNGDGEQSRDFTYIANVIYMNDLALFTQNRLAINQIYNCACGKKTSLNQILEYLKKINNKELKINYVEERVGDVKHSLGSIRKAKNLLGYEPLVDVYSGLNKTMEYLKFNEKSI